MHRFHIFVVLGLAVLSGCKPSSTKYDRVPLEGTATLNGNPFVGSIALRPQPGTSGPVVNVPVENGAFAFDKKTGPVVGPHVVILMPAKTSRDQVSESTDVIVPNKEPYRIEVAVTSAQVTEQKVRGIPIDTAPGGK